MLNVRSFQAGDAEALGRVYHHAIREGAVEAYGAAAVRAWSPEAPSGANWAERLATAETVVAEAEGTPVGFMSLVPETGLIDLAFVLPEAARSGVASALYAVLEGRARATGLACLTTEASLLAEPFFAVQGFQVVARQEVERRGVMLKNCRMEKRLAAGEAAA